MEIPQRTDLMQWDREQGTITYDGQTLSVPAGPRVLSGNDEFFALLLTEASAVALHALLTQVLDQPGVRLTGHATWSLRDLRTLLDRFPLHEDLKQHIEPPIIEMLPPLLWDD